MNLNEEQIKLLEESLELINAKRVQFADSVYENLFRRQPELQPMFENINIMSQRDKLIATLALVIGNLRTPGAMEEDLRRLGKRHTGSKVKPEQYPMVESAIIETFALYLDSRWSTAHHGAWKSALSSISKVMVAG